MPTTKNRRPSRRAVIAGAAGLAFAQPFAIARAQGAPLKVGVVLPRSGPQGKIGQSCQQGYDLALPILKELGYPEIQYMPVDTETNVQRARAVTEKVIQDGAQIVTGAFDSGATTALAQVCEQKGVPLVINIAAAPPITEQGYKFVFRNFPNGVRIAQDALNLQRELYEYKKDAPKSAVLLHVNDTFGESLKAGLLGLMQRIEMPYKFADVIAYDPNARDLSVEIAKAKATGAELLWTVSRLNDAMLLTRELIKQRWSPKAVVSSGPGFYEDQYLKTLGKNGDHIISLVPWYDPSKPLTRYLLERGAKAYPGINIDTNHVYSFEAALICADAFKRAGSADPGKLRDALAATNIKNNVSIGPGIAFDAKGHNGGLGNAGIQNRGGKLKVVVPRAYADSEPVYPMPAWDKRA